MMETKVVELRKTVYELCSKDPQIVEILVQVGFTDVVKPGLLQTAGRFMTIPKGAALKKIDIETVKQAFIDHGYEVQM